MLDKLYRVSVGYLRSTIVGYYIGTMILMWALTQTGNLFIPLYGWIAMLSICVVAVLAFSLIVARKMSEYSNRLDTQDSTSTEEQLGG